MILTHMVFFDFFPGAAEGETPEPAASTYAPNWLSPSIRLGLILMMLWRA